MGASSSCSGSGSRLESKDPFLGLHETLALLLLQDLAHGPVLRGGHGQAQRTRGPTWHQVEHDVRHLAEGHAPDASVGQEPRVRPYPVAVEADLDARGERHDQDEVERHHRLAEDVMDGPVHGGVEDGDGTAHDAEDDLQRVMAWLRKGPGEDGGRPHALELRATQQAAAVEDGEIQAQPSENDREHELVRLRHQEGTAARAASASATRSAASSTPSDTRTRPGSIPAARSWAWGYPWWDGGTGKLTSVSTPPRLAARAMIRKPS